MMIMCPFIIASCRYENCTFYSEKTEKCVFQLIMEELENDKDNMLNLFNKKVKK